MQRFIQFFPFLALVLLILFYLLLVGCGSLSALQAIVSATEAAVPILQAAGVSIPPQVATYVADVAACVAGADGSQATASELLEISSCLAVQVAPNLPPGVPQEVVTIMAQIAEDIGAFLKQHPASKPGQIAAHPKLSKNDIALYANLRDRARVARNNLKPQ